MTARISKTAFPVFLAAILILTFSACTNSSTGDPLSPTKEITAFSFTSPASTGTITGTAIAVTVPFGTNVTALVANFTTTGVSVKIGSTIQTSGVTANDFTSPIEYIVTAENGSTQSYTVTVIIASTSASDKAITAFSFVSPSATGTITEAAHTIAVTVPYGTNVTALAPTITHTGASINPASGVSNNFTGSQIYTVTAADSSTQAYTVTVTVSSASAKAITAFTFPTSTATTITEAAHTIAVTVPYGTNVTALVPTITHTGASISPASGVSNNFTGSQTYTVTAADSSTQAYTVTVTVSLSSAKAITAFTFPTSTATTITEAAHTIAVTVPYGTIVTALVPTITHTGASISPASGVANNFSSQKTYTVTAADSSTQAYTVTVNTLAEVTTTAIAGNLIFTVNISGTSAKGGGNVTHQGSSVVSSRGLCWNTSGSPTITDPHAADGTGTGVYTNVSLTGLSKNTIYHVRAYATNGQGTAYGNEITFNSGYPYDGTVNLGGYVFYNNGSGGGLAVATTIQSTGIQWYNGRSITTGASGTAIGTGLTNTNAIVSSQGAGSYAAKLCYDLVLNTYSDWFLPSMDELNQLAYHNTFTSEYIGLTTYYWSSTDSGSGNIYVQNLFDFTSSSYAKSMSSVSVIAIRSF